MRDRSMRRRPLISRYVAVLCAVLAVVTLFVPDWIEELTGYDADNGNGAVEALVVAALFLVALATGGYSVVAMRRAETGRIRGNRGMP
jgi:uncharacterized membrane protein YphA (DoxX/SURF4 family)